MLKVSEKTIYSLLQKDDIKGFEYLFNLYYRPLVLWVDTFLNDMQASEDLVQDFFVRFWEKKIYKKLYLGKFKSFLYTSIYHMTLNVLQKKDLLRKTYPLESLDKNWEEFDEQREVLLKGIEHEIEKLPNRSREVVIAVYLKGMKYREIATLLGISEVTVKTLLVLSLKRLRKVINVDNYILLVSFLSRNTRK